MIDKQNVVIICFKEVHWYCNGRKKMRIRKILYENIQNIVNPFPPECGGILGRKGNIITDFVYDEGMKSEKMCNYVPNVKFFNETIQRWQNEDITFAGIFHTHYFGIRTLSYGDRCYIKEIMKNMPDEVNELYFPIIVMPQKEMVAYKAMKDVNEILIVEDEVYLE